MKNVVELIISGNNRRLDDAITRSSRTIQRFGDRASAVFTRTGRIIKNMSEHAMMPFAQIASGAAIAMAGRQVIAFDARLARLAIQARLTRQQTIALKQSLMDAGRQTYQAPEELLAGMEQIVEKTGNIELAKNSILDMGYAASATGAEMAAIGAVTSNLNDKLGITQEQMRGAFDILNEQGKAGAFTLREMATLGERLFTSAASFGIRGSEGLRKFGAFVQVARTGTGSSEMATTAVERTMADMLTKSKKIQAVTGFSIFDEAASKKEGRAVTKDFELIMKELIRRTNGDTVKLRKIFGEESIRAMDALALSYKKFGDFRIFDDYMKQGGDAVQMMSDFGRWTETAAAKMTQFRIELTRFADENLAKPIELLTEALDVLNKHPIIVKGGLAAILGLTGMAALASIIRMMQTIFGAGKKGEMPGSGGFGAFGKTPIPVYVVNKNLSMLPETYGSGHQTPGGKVPKIPGGPASLLALLSTTVSMAVGTAATAYSFAKYPFLSGVPLASSEGVNKFSAEQDALLAETQQWGRDHGFVKNDIQLNITIDRNGRVTTDSGHPNTAIRVDLNRGTWDNPLGAY